jgi:hypothetical protein
LWQQFPGGRKSLTWTCNLLDGCFVICLGSKWEQPASRYWLCMWSWKSWLFTHPTRNVMLLAQHAALTCFLRCEQLLPEECKYTWILWLCRHCHHHHYWSK